jgi:hypothetical protein
MYCRTCGCTILTTGEHKCPMRDTGPEIAREYKQRLERIATAVLAGYVSNSDIDVHTADEQWALWAVRTARALIAELDKEPTK